MRLMPPQLTVNDQRRLMFWVTALDEVLPVYARLAYRGHMLKQDDRGWLLVLKASGTRGNVVAFFTGHRPWVCWLACALALKKGQVRWRVDRPPPDMGD